MEAASDLHWVRATGSSKARLLDWLTASHSATRSGSATALRWETLLATPWGLRLEVLKDLR